MTTVGRTELENAAARGCLGGEENIPKALKKMKVRFGEIITENVVAREHSLHPGDGDYEHSILETNNTRTHQEEDTISSQTASTARNSRSPEATDDDQVAAEEVNNAMLSSGAEVDRASDAVIRETGFGLAEEMVPLEKRIQYGRSMTETGKEG
jgi:hypothetical protein